MNEEEVQIDLMTLLHYILRKWRSIIVMMLILAVAANPIFCEEEHGRSGSSRRSAGEEYRESS